MRYRRMPIEIESPEQTGYGRIACNLAESSIADVLFRDLNLNLNDLVLSYDDHLGKPGLREIIASSSPGLHPEQVITTVGAAAALFIVATSLLNAGDHLVVVFPNYATNIETPRQIGANVEFHPLSFEGGYRLDVDTLAARIRPETRYVSITLPHNPTGSMIPESDLRRLIGIIEAKGCYLLVDETYREMGYTATLPIAASLSSRVISVSSLSKTYGLPGIRLGWLITQDDALRETFLAAKEQIFINTSVLDETAAYQYLLNKDDHLARIKTMIQQRLQIMRDWMAEEPLMEWVEPQGGVVCFPRVIASAQVDMDQFYKLLLEKYGTFVGAGHWFESDRRHMRLGFGWPTEDELTTGLRHISQTLREVVGIN
ncbi:MAG: pyridoxal phosphate-dependent aminotransferase [Anaerolineae bacterium]|nr:pyridoxal phosphate-dependent aminotransferase [Anaerolineae bacterium]